MSEQRRVDRPFIPDAVSRAAVNYVCICRWCGYDLRNEKDSHLPWCATGLGKPKADADG